MPSCKKSIKFLPQPAVVAVLIKRLNPISEFIDVCFKKLSHIIKKHSKGARKQLGHAAKQENGLTNGQTILLLEML
jgi:hypothetical protein